MHLNPAARNLLEVGENDEKSYRKGTFYRSITSQEVEDALWLYQYGFPQGRTKLDGAYYRQILLSELVEGEKSSQYSLKRAANLAKIKSMDVN